ncbi:hypothetical protein POTOM_015737 [Populus tomentosa]|uniref:FAD/NAD(P)-binding oxidoreductase family protein n=1 Tax=Populus tomentosa TaxID=118781 RepID=A0A8X8D687_POPTO|nr:hypothetical protein POTOM_015737 [Populus tomentosa]
MSFHLARFFLQFGISSRTASINSSSGYYHLLFNPNKRKFTATAIPTAQKSSKEELLVVVGGGAAGVYGAIRAKTLAPNLDVLVVEKGNPLSKVKISGGGRCNVTNGHCSDIKILAEQYPRGHREFKGSFFEMHGPADTMSWFTDHGVALKIEEDGRVFPTSNSSSSVIDCLLSEAKHRGVSLQTRKVVSSASVEAGGKFLLKLEKRTVSFVENVKADYLLITSGSSQQGHSLAAQLGHSIVDPVPSLFTFKIADSGLAELSGVTFPKEVLIDIKFQVGPMLITHWGLSGPVILRLSAWGARDLFSSGYKGTLTVDFVPDFHIEDMKSILNRHKHKYAGLIGDALWASISNNSIVSIAHLLKHCAFEVTGKGQYKDEFVTAGDLFEHNGKQEMCTPFLCRRGNVPYSQTFQVLNVDGVTGGFNFQNAWSGGYIAGTSIGELAAEATLEEGIL